MSKLIFHLIDELWAELWSNNLSDLHLKAVSELLLHSKTVSTTEVFYLN